MKSGLLFDLRKELEDNVDSHTKETAQHFFKEQIKVYGIKTATVGRISKKYFKDIKGLDKKEIFRLCEELFSSGYMEESFIACNWSYNVHDDFEEKDLLIFEGWILKYVHNWATCDTLCNHTVGALIEKFPHLAKELRRWARSDNRWMRRASAVSLIVPAKRGLFLKDAFEISDILLRDNDDLVQKGYGWLLKEESRVCQKEVFDYVIKNKKMMPRTALRYAIEKMPKELKEKAMAK
jgi:3-methyladenine DNA glycosylase AlkD